METSSCGQVLGVRSFELSTNKGLSSVTSGT